LLAVTPRQRADRLQIERLLVLHDAIDEDVRRNHGLGIDGSGFDDVVDFDDGGGRSGGEDRMEVARRAPVDDIAAAIGRRGAQQGEIGAHSSFQNIPPPVEDARFLAGDDVGADAGWGVECRQSGAAGAHPFDQRALRHQLERDLPGLDRRLDRRGARRVGGEAGDELLDLAILGQDLR